MKVEQLITELNFHPIMRLSRGPKYSSDVGIRTIPPTETLERALPLLDVAGLCELQDISTTDRIGIPVWSISRANPTEGAVSNYNGKGPTKEQAMASAVMEAMERYSAEQRDCDEIVMGTFTEMSSRGLTVDPRGLILPMRTYDYVMDQPIAWTRGYEMFRGEQAWVPANAVFHPYFCKGDLQLFRYHTNGIASGNTMEEAVLHALLELVERDAWSISDFRDHVNADVIVRDEDSVCNRLMRQCEENGVVIHLKDLTSDLGIPTIGAAADDVETEDPELLVIGVGTHLNPEVAAVRAITEVAQSRTTHCHGVKANPKTQKIVQEMGYEKIKRINRKWYSPSGRETVLEDMQRLDTPYVLDDIEVVLGSLVENGFEMVVAVDLTRDEIGVPTVRMVVPGLEVYTMDPEREGPRLKGLWPLTKVH